MRRWTAFAPVANGGAIGGNSRYIQYRATFATSAPDRTAELSAVTLGYTTESDVGAPTITSRTPAAGATGVSIGSNVTVTFSEPMDPATITSATFTLQPQAGGPDVPAAVSYDDVTRTATLDPLGRPRPDTSYVATVASSVADASGNPLGTEATWTFTTAVDLSSLTDTTAAEFGAGTTGADTYVSDTSGGELILAPTVGSEFQGTNLPSGWSSTPWTAGGGSTVAGGVISVDAARANPTAAPAFGPGRSLEFSATFGAGTFQNAGLRTGSRRRHRALGGLRNGELDDEPVHAGQHGCRLGRRQPRFLADRIRASVPDRLEPVPDRLLGRRRRRRHADRRHRPNMRPVISDFALGGAVVAVDWLRMSPYPATGTFTSRVLDAHGAATWSSLDWTAQTPAGTSVALSYRTGDSLDTGSGWTAFQPVAASGDALTGTSRYIQYRAVLSTTDPAVTPTLSSVSVQYVGGER